MNLKVNQNIVIHQLKIGGMSNSSVLQVGSAGVIRTVSNLYNTGEFTGPAPEAKPLPPSLVPLLPPADFFT